MKNLLISVILFLSVNVHAGGSFIVIAYGTGKTPVSSSIDVDAELNT